MIVYKRTYIYNCRISLDHVWTFRFLINVLRLVSHSAGTQFSMKKIPTSSSWDALLHLLGCIILLCGQLRIWKPDKIYFRKPTNNFLTFQGFSEYFFRISFRINLYTENKSKRKVMTIQKTRLGFKSWSYLLFCMFMTFPLCKYVHYFLL